MQAENPDPPPGELTSFLSALSGGDAKARPELMAFVYAELRKLAQSAFRHQPAGHTLQPTALVHEAFVKLFGSEGAAWKDRVHFFALASRAMRQLLVDHARALATAKRGEGAQRTLSEGLAPAAGPSIDLLDLDEALRELAALDERQARVVELRYFGGLEAQEAASVIGVSLATVERDWRAARAWLGRRLHLGEER